MERGDSLYVIVEADCLKKAYIGRLQWIVQSLNIHADATRITPVGDNLVEIRFFWLPKQASQIIANVRRHLFNLGYLLTRSTPIEQQIRPRITSLEQIGRLCGVRPETVADWLNRKQLAKSILRYKQRASIVAEKFNLLLADCAHNFSRPPSLEDLESGRLVLIDASGANAKFGFNQKWLWEVAKREGMPFIKFPGLRARVCFSEAALERMKSIDPYTLFFVAAHVIDGSYALLDRLVAAHKLERAYPGFDKRSKYISFRSFSVFLKELLPSWISPLDWIKIRLATPGRLLLAEEVNQLVGGWNQRSLLMDACALPYIKSASEEIYLFDPTAIPGAVRLLRDE